MSKDVASAIDRNFTSPNVSDSNGEPANIVDAVQYMAMGIHKIANAITPSGVAPATDATGGHVASLTEAVMGATRAMQNIADATNRLSDER